MADTSRLDELERKFAENPRRYFAPLANEHRKAGDLAGAIAICREQLARFPAHMSGHVVLGQALYESRQREEAQTAFERALALDPENLIALRHLGDIARDRGDGSAARAWYQRVLEADPRNDDIAAQLQRLAPAAPVARPAGTVPTSFAPPTLAPPPILEPLDWSALDLELPGTPPAADQPREDESVSETAELPVAEAGPAASPGSRSEPWTDATAVDELQPAVVDAAHTEPAPGPVDWMELLPDHGGPETAGEPAADKASPDEVAADHAPYEAEEPTTQAPSEPLVSTVEEIWMPATALPAVEPDHVPEPEPEPELERESEPVPDAEPESPTLAVADERAAEPTADDVRAEPPALQPITLDASFDLLSDASLGAPPAVEPGWTTDVDEDLWIDGAAPLDLSPDGFGLAPPGVDAVEEPLPNAFVGAADDAFEIQTILTASPIEIDEPSPLAEDAHVDAVLVVEPEAVYDPVVGLDLPPIAADEPEPYAEAERASRMPTPTGVPSVAFMTETMAGLLLEQGHLDQALEVYDRLLAQRPDDESLAVRVAALRASAALPAVEAEVPAEVQAEEPARADVVGGATAGAFFAALAVATPAGPSAVEQPAAERAPTAEPAPAARPGLLAGDGTADDEHAARRLAGGFAQPDMPMASLADALFMSPPSLPAAAMPPAPAPSASEAPYGMGDFSFERFFEGLEEGAPPAFDAPTAASAQPPTTVDPWESTRSVPAPPVRAVTPAAGQRAVDAAPPTATPAPAAATDDEDLAQFHAWLKGLMDS